MIDERIKNYFNYIISKQQNISEEIKNEQFEVLMESYRYHELISTIKTNATILNEENVTNLEVTMLESMQSASSSLSKYINKVSKLKTEKDVNAAIARYRKNPNQKDFDELIKKYSKQMSKAIWSNKSKLSKYDIDISFDEVFNIMIQNLERAIQTYDLEYGIKFTTHLNPWIYEVIRNPSKYVGKLRTKIKQSNVDKMKSGKVGKGAMAHVSSGDVRIKNSDGDSTTPFDMLIGNNGDFEQEYNDRTKMRVMHKLIKQLSDVEQKIINIKFGFNDDDKYKNKYGNVTSTIIAKELGVSIPTVNNILDKALGKLRLKLGVK